MGRVFWTIYRRMLVETMLAQGHSRALIADRLGVSVGQLTAAISFHGLKPRLLEDRGHG